MGQPRRPSLFLPWQRSPYPSVISLWPVRDPLRVAVLLLGAASIATLLLYFYGVTEMHVSVRGILIPAAALLLLLTLWAGRTRRLELYERILAGLWAGTLATLAYDVVRVPIVWSGVPVFKAISYFGTVIAGQATPSVTSEAVGWGYHLSNGIGFGLMYAAWVSAPRWWTAILWGLLLEGAMLVTPYAEVFGYKVSPQFLAITIGAHVVYGVTLWAALRYWLAGGTFGASVHRSPWRLTLLGALVPFGIGAIATDFYLRHAVAIPPSPPPYLGSHLYTTWDVPEPDRVAAMWALQRFIDRQARFHFVSPFDSIRYGRPFDVPEAEIRRRGTNSATEVLLTEHGLDSDARLRTLAAVTHLVEVTPWLLPIDRQATQLVQAIRNVAAETCGRILSPGCTREIFRLLDEWYDRQ